MKWIRWTIWALLAVIVLEASARIDDWLTQGAPLSGIYDISVIHEFDSLGQKGRPGARFGKWKMNSLGYRGLELRPGTVRLLAVGSSETFGQYESENHEWPRQLEEKLNARAGQPVYQVVNTAIAGETLPATLRRLPLHLDKVQPAAVILYPSLAHYVFVPYLPAKFTPPPPRRFASRLSDRVSTLLKRALPEQVQTRIRIWQTERAARQYGAPLQNMPADLQQRFAGDLRAMVALLRERQVEPVFVTHATRFGNNVTPEERFMLQNWRKFYPMFAEEGLLRAEESMNGVMQQVAKEMDVVLIEAANRMPTGPAYYADFVHFTDKGAEAFAEIVSRGLEPCLRRSAVRASAAVAHP